MVRLHYTWRRWTITSKYFYNSEFTFFYKSSEHQTISTWTNSSTRFTFQLRDLTLMVSSCLMKVVYIKIDIAMTIQKDFLGKYPIYDESFPIAIIACLLSCLMFYHCLVLCLNCVSKQIKNILVQFYNDKDGSFLARWKVSGSSGSLL